MEAARFRLALDDTRLVFDSKAALDLENISRWIGHDSPSAAKDVVGRIRATCSKLLAFPALGKEGLDPGMRELVVAGSPYIVVYRIEDDQDQIVIAAIVHSARDRQTD